MGRGLLVEGSTSWMRSSIDHPCSSDRSPIALIHPDTKKTGTSGALRTLHSGKATLSLTSSVAADCMARSLRYPTRESGDRVVKRKTNEAVTITVRLPRHTWPEQLILPAHSSPAAVRLLRGRLTGLEAVLVLRIEGSIHELREALLYWERCGVTVEKVNGKGRQYPRRGTGKRSHASMRDRGSSSRGFTDFKS